MNQWTAVVGFYKKHLAMRVATQLVVILIIYFAIRYWKSLDDIRGVAPIIKAVDLDGNKIDLRQYKNKPVLIHFWASWCPVCQFENSNIESLTSDYQVVTIASWSGNEVEVKEYLKKENINMPVIVDDYAEWAKLYSVKSVPASFFVDANGEIQFIENGYTSEAGFRLRLWWLSTF